MSISRPSTHLQSEEIVERLYHTVVPTLAISPAGSAAEEVSACHDALALVQWRHPAQLLVPSVHSSVGISSLKSVLVVGVLV